MTPRAPKHARRRAVASRRGFLLPLVILVVIAVSLTTGVMLQRQAAQRQLVQQQIDAYQTRHGIRGIQRLIVAYMDALGATDIRDVIDPGGRAFLIEPGDGTRVLVDLYPAQHALRVTPSGADATAELDNLRAGLRLRQRLALDRASLDFLTRQVGPIRISAADAPRPVLESIAEAILQDTSLAQGFATDIEDARQTGEFNQQALTDAIDATVERLERASVAGDLEEDRSSSSSDRSDDEADGPGPDPADNEPDPEELGERLLRLLTTDVRLWEMRLTLEGAGPNATAGVLARYRALFLRSDPGSGSTAPFLAWEKLDLNAPPPPDPLGRPRP